MILGFSGDKQPSRLHLTLGCYRADEDGIMRFLLDSGGFRYQSVPIVNFKFDEWFHLAFVQNDDWFGFYINGELQWQEEVELSDSYSWGNWQDGDMTVGNNWPGYIDELRISDVALLPSQFLCAAIPEPSTLALFALGGGLLAAKRRKK